MKADRERLLRRGLRRRAGSDSQHPLQLGQYVGPGRFQLAEYGTATEIFSDLESILTVLKRVFILGYHASCYRFW